MPYASSRSLRKTRRLKTYTRYTGWHHLFVLLTFLGATGIAKLLYPDNKRIDHREYFPNGSIRRTARIRTRQIK